MKDATPPQGSEHYARAVAALTRIKVRWPTMRVGQIIESAVGRMNIYHIEDDELAQKLEEFYQRIPEDE